MILDPSAADRSLIEVARAALQAGAPSLQLRAKNHSARLLTETAREILAETRRTGALLFVNDRVDVALAVGADGAHLGDDDLPLGAARAIAGEGFIVGRSVDDAEEARVATREGADYVGVGPVYSTGSKTGLGAPIGPNGVRSVVGATRIPVVGIGGIGAQNAEEVAAAGAAGVAVIQVVMAATDPGAAVRELLEAVRRGRTAAGI